MKQGATGVDISYAYVYLFSEWLTPGEVLYSSFRKLPLFSANKLLITGYTLYKRNPSLESHIIKDTTFSLTNDFSGATGLQWDSTWQLNGGTPPGVNEANPELLMCESGEVWSRGGACYPESRTLGLQSDPSVSFVLANTGEYSFVLWFQYYSTLTSVSLLSFNSGETKVHISSATSSLIWSRAEPL